MVPVVASLLALGLGPVLLAAARERRWVLGAVDGFVVVTIGGIVLLHILPHAFLVGGWPMLVVAAVGLFGPALIERGVGPRLSSATRWMLPLALVGLALHAFLDGTVLVDSHEGHGHEASEGGGLMALGVMLHRVPEGLAIWWVFRRRHGLSGALLALFIIAAATVGGFLFGEHLEGMLGPLHGLQALVAGSLLHVVSHRSHDTSAPSAPASGHACELDYDPPGPTAHNHDHDHGGLIDETAPSTAGRFGQAPAALGALLGVALLWGVSLAHPASHRISSEIGMGATFLTLALESAPALLLSYGFVGLTHAFWPGSASRWLARGGALSQALRALLLGPLVPVCSCGVIPLYRGLLARATPAPAAVTLLVAAPGLGLATLLLSLSLLGPRMTLARAGGALLVALVLGLVVGGSIQRPATPADAPAPAPPAPTGHRLRTGLTYAATDVVDYTLPWILLGLGVAAFLEPSLTQGALARTHSVPFFAALSIPLYICAAGVTPLVAVLMHKGLSAGAALALLVAGPAANLGTFRALAQLHGGRAAWLFAGLLFALATALGYGLNATLGPHDPVALHDVARERPELFNVVCLSLLVALGLSSLVRRGPRFWVDQIIATEHQHLPR